MDFDNHTEASLRQGKRREESLSCMSYRKETSAEPWSPDRWEEKEGRPAISWTVWADDYSWAKENKAYQSMNNLDRDWSKLNPVDDIPSSKGSPFHWKTGWKSGYLENSKLCLHQNK